MQELEGIAQDTGALPQSLANRPLLIHEGLSLYLDAFFEINDSRQFTMGGTLPLSYTDKSKYCDDWDYRGEFRVRMMSHLTSLDRAYLAYLRKLAEIDKPDRNRK